MTLASYHYRMASRVKSVSTADPAYIDARRARYGLVHSEDPPRARTDTVKLVKRRRPRPVEPTEEPEGPQAVPETTGKGFTMIPNEAIRYPGVSRPAKCLYGILTSFHREDMPTRSWTSEEGTRREAEVWPSMADLVAHMGVSESYARKLLAELEDADYVHRDGRRFSVYVVDDAEEGGWTKIPISFIRNPAITARARGTYMAVEAYSHGKAFAWPSVRTLAADLGCGRATVVRDLAELEAKGAIAREGSTVHLHVMREDWYLRPA